MNRRRFLELLGLAAAAPAVGASLAEAAPALPAAVIEATAFLPSTEELAIVTTRAKAGELVTVAFMTDHYPLKVWMTAATDMFPGDIVMVESNFCVRKLNASIGAIGVDEVPEVDEGWFRRAELRLP